MQPSFYEFFAGGGMARAGLGKGWRCLFANDFDHKKAMIYKENWGGSTIKVGDVRYISTKDLPERANLAWASFPCQDLSLAGGGAGLRGERSGTFWPFWKLMTELVEIGRAPEIIALENVYGALTSHQGKDFVAIISSFQEIGYNFGAMIVDAIHFVPQSRPRLFIIGVRGDLEIDCDLTSNLPSSLWHPPALVNAVDKLSTRSRESWRWWNLPQPSVRTTTFSDLLEEEPNGVCWHSQEETRRLLAMMSDINMEKVELAKKSGKRMIGCIYKRTRQDEFKRKVQRAEVRFDDVSGCLRTPAGGSSRQVVLVVEGDSIQSRLISARETARLMGLPDTYWLPENYNEAYHLTGDGVSVPVVRHLAAHIFEPLLENVSNPLRKVAA